jgi:hypothetical protein
LLGFGQGLWLQVFLWLLPLCRSHFAFVLTNLYVKSSHVGAGCMLSDTASTYMAAYHIHICQQGSDCLVAANVWHRRHFGGLHCIMFKSFFVSWIIVTSSSASGRYKHMCASLNRSLMIIP